MDVDYWARCNNKKFFYSPEVWVIADAVSLPGPEVITDAEEPKTEIPAGDEDEGVSL